MPRGGPAWRLARVSVNGVAISLTVADAALACKLDQRVTMALDQGCMVRGLAQSVARNSASGCDSAPARHVPVAERDPSNVGCAQNLPLTASCRWTVPDPVRSLACRNWGRLCNPWSQPSNNRFRETANPTLRLARPIGYGWRPPDAFLSQLRRATWERRQSSACSSRCSFHGGSQP